MFFQFRQCRFFGYGNSPDYRYPADNDLYGLKMPFTVYFIAFVYYNTTIWEME